MKHYTEKGTNVVYKTFTCQGYTKEMNQLECKCTIFSFIQVRLQFPIFQSQQKLTVVEKQRGKLTQISLPETHGRLAAPNKKWQNLPVSLAKNWLMSEKLFWLKKEMPGET